MAQKLKNFSDAAEEIRIPMEYVDEIDRIIGSGMSIYPSRNEFIKSAVQIHLKNATCKKNTAPRGFSPR